MPNHYTTTLTMEQARSLRALLERSSAFAETKRDYALYCFVGMDVNVAFYAKRGKLLVQGKGTQDFLKLLPPQFGCSEASDLSSRETHSGAIIDVTPHFGVDESGKGDYFGPLVVAGVYADAANAQQLAAIGCRDSKTIGSDERIAHMAEQIRALPGVAYEVLCIGPRRYNELYAQMKNLNRLLAWGHVRVIAALHAEVPECPRALSDQFADESVLLDALEQRRIPIRLDQRPRAEEDIAVAAASILARARFVEWMHEAATSSGCSFPLGCASHVLQAARDFVAKYGAERLPEVVKLHFKLTSQL